MRIAIVGGTGRTGRLVVERAVAAGHRLRVLARRPEEARASFAHLDQHQVEIVAGDLRDAASVAALMSDGDGAVAAVLSAAGPVKGGGDTDLHDGARHVVAAMQEAGVARLVWMSGAGVRFPHDRPGAVDKAVVAVMQLVARRTLHDSRAAVELVTGSALDWTVVRAPRLTDGPASVDPTVAEGVGFGAGLTASRATVAQVLVDTAATDAWLRGAPVVSD